MEVQKISGSDLMISSMMPSSTVRNDQPQTATPVESNVNTEKKNADSENKGSHFDSFA